MEELKFNNYKERQNYYRELYKNRGNVIHISKIVGRDGSIWQKGSTYTSEKGEIRAMKRKAKQERKRKVDY